MLVLFPIVGALYFSLWLVSVALLFQIVRHRRSFRNFSQYRENVLVVTALTCYSLTRSIVVFLQVFSVISQTVSNPTTNFFDSLSGLFFALMQLSMMVRWSHRARELAAHAGSPFLIGTVAAFVSSSLLFVSAMLSTLFVIHWDAFSTKFYLTVCTLSWAALYIYNGLTVLCLTLYLSCHVQTHSESGQKAKWQILIIAAVFSLMCVMRGAGDIVYVSTTDGEVTSVASDSWASPAILLAEFGCIVFIFGVMCWDHVVAAVARGSLIIHAGSRAAGEVAVVVDGSYLSEDDEASYLHT